MKHYGDICEMNGAEIEPVDCITGGSPCQDLSVAGARAGLKGERSGLFTEMIRIIKEMRDATDGKYPTYAIWENVSGAFSSNRGEDFRSVLDAFIHIVEPKTNVPRLENGEKWSKAGLIIGSSWSIGWRLFDAQYWGVPQRRQRIALVADFRGWSAGKILFEQKSLRGDTEESREQREEASGSTETSLDESNPAFTLKIRGGKSTYIKADGSIGTAGKGALIQKDLSGTLGVSQDQTLFAKKDPVISFDPGACRYISTTMEDKSLTLAPGTAPGFHNGVVYSTQACGDRNNPSQSYIENKAYTIPSNPMSDRGQAVAYGIGRDAFNMGENAKFGMSISDEVQPPLTAKGPGGGNADIIGSLCASDYKGVGNQYVYEGKCIIDRKSSE